MGDQFGVRTHGAAVSFRATIVIPVLNQRADWLEQCVLSGLSQTVGCETIVVTSPETAAPTLTQLARIGRENSGLRVLQEKGTGFAAALNTGICAASSSRVGFLLSDDWLEKKAVETCLRFESDIVSTGLRGYASDGKQVFESISRSPSVEEFHRLSTLELKASYLKHFLFFRKEKLLAVGGVDETIGLTGPDDFDLPWTLLEQGATVSLIPDQLYNYRDHEGERLTLRSAEAQVQDLSRILDKHAVGGEERERIVRRHSLSYGHPYHVTAKLRKARLQAGSPGDSDSPRRDA
jgi:glycosyltransferase involved in cell wall biosynthesis